MADDTDTKKGSMLSLGSLTAHDGPAVVLSSINPHVIKLLLYAQEFYPEQYQHFVDKIDGNNIPWLYENDAFVNELNAFASQFSWFLSEHGVNDVRVNQSFPDRIVDPLAGELRRVTQLRTRTNRAFVHNLTMRMIDALRRQNVAIEDEMGLETSIQSRVDEATARGLGSDELSREVQRGVRGAVLPLLNDSQMLFVEKVLPSVVEPELSRLHSVADVQKTEEALARAILTEQSVYHREYFARALTMLAAEKPEKDIQQIISQAKVFTQIGEALTALIPHEITTPGAEPWPLVPLHFFNTGARGMRGAFARTGDAILSVLPTKTREAMMRSFSTRWLEKATLALGTPFVQSGVYQKAIAMAMRSFGTQEPGTGAIKSLFIDLGSSIFGNQSSFYQSYLRAVAFDAQMPQGLRFFQKEHGPSVFYHMQDGGLWPAGRGRASSQFVGTIYTQFSLYHFPVAAFQTQGTQRQMFSLSFLSSFNQWVVGKIKSSAVRSAAKGAAGAAAKKTLSALLAKFLTKIGISITADAVLALFTGGVGTVIKWIIQAVVWLGGTILKPIASFIGKMLRGDLLPGVGALKEFASGIFGNVQTKKQWYEQEWFLILVGCLLIFLAPLLMGAAFMTTTAFPIVQNAKDFSGEGSADNVLPPECQGENLPKPQADPLISVVNGTKYAFPLAPYNRTYYTCTHWDNLLATDIGINGINTGDRGVHLPVVAYTDGTILEASTNDPKGGKYVILRGVDGRFYYYAHNCSLYVSAGQTVSAGEVIATSDNSGSAADTPEHVHFAISSSPSFSGGGTVCPSEDFQNKLGITRCSLSEQCKP